MALGISAAGWLSAGAGLIGSALSSDASGDAADAQAGAANNAAATQERMFNKGVELQEPWRKAGMGALSSLVSGTGAGGDFMRDFTLADFTQDPGYQFRMDQGRNALESSAAARGGLLSGGTGKALVEYGQQAASGEYANAYNRFNADRDRRFNRLSSLAGIGQTATRDVAQQGNQLGSSLGELSLQSGNAQASGIVGQANAWNKGLSSIGNWWQQQQPAQSTTPPNSGFIYGGTPYYAAGD